MNTGIPLILNFDLKAPLPLDQRLSVNVTGELNSIVQPYSGMAVYSADTQTVYYLKNITNGTKTWVDFPSSAQFVKNYGDETINGIKTFSSRPNLNGNGFLVQGDITMGDVIGIPNFQTNAVYNDNILMNSNSTGYLTGVGYSGNFDGGYFFGRTKITQNRSRIHEASIGENFTAVGSLPGAWRWLSCSSDAQYITASRDNNFLYVSNNFGKTWYATAKEFGNLNWRGTAMSADGKYQIAVTTFLAGGAGIVAVSKDYGNSWTQKFNNTNDWVNPAMSSDGKYQTVIYSNNADQTVTIYRSNNYGESFSAVNAIANSIVLRALRFIAMSSDGKYQTIVTTKYILTSSNYGVTWTRALETPNSVPFFSNTMSADGRFQLVVSAGKDNFEGRVYASNDYGLTWKITKDFGLYSSLTSIANSDHGRLSVLTVKNGFVFTSVDYGNNWKLATTKENITTTLASAITTTTETSINVNSSLNMSVDDTLGSTFLQIDNEILRITNIVGNTLTVARGSMGTVAAPHINNSIVILSKDLRRTVMSNDGKYLIICENNYNNENRQGYISISTSEEKIDGNFYADNLVYISGNQTIAGVKTFTTEVTAPNLVYNTGNQTISGVKTFSSAPTFSAGASFNGARIANAIPETVTVTNNLNLDASHNCKIILANSPTPFSITGVSSLGAGFNVSVIQQGLGQITIATGVGTTLNSYGNLYKTAGPYAAVSILGLGGGNFIMYGNTA